MERQPSFQAVTKDQEISGMVEAGDDGSSQSKAYSEGVDQIVNDQFLKGCDVVAKEISDSDSGHGGSEQMEFEKEEGVYPPPS